MTGGNWGWQGLDDRALEFPDGRAVEVSPGGRARIRYSDQAKQVEVSIDGGAYVLLGGGSPVALAQATWFVDPVSGSDKNDGATIATALATLSEYTRRIGTGVVEILQTLTVLSDLALGSAGVAFLGNYRIGLTVKGVRTVQRSGSVTAVQVWDPSISDEGQLTDSGVANWGADVNRLVVLTSGASSGAAGWVGSDLGGGDTCRYSPFFDSVSFSEKDPAIGNTYDVVTLTRITGNVVMENMGFIQLQDLELTDTSFLGALRVSNGQSIAIYCRLDDLFGSIIDAGMEAAFTFAGCDINLVNLDIGNDLVFISACLVTALIVVKGGASLTMSTGPSLWQGTPGIRVLANGSFEVRGQGYAVFDMPGASDNALNVRISGTASITTGRMFGTGNDGASAVGLRIDSGGMLYFQGTPTDRFSFSGSSLTEINLADDTAITYATIPAAGTNGTNTVRNAGIVPFLGV